MDSRARAFLKFELGQMPPTDADAESVARRDFAVAFKTFNSTELAEIFVSANFFRSILQPLIDEQWLRDHGDAPHTIDSRHLQMTNELHALDFLRDEILSSTPRELKTLISRAGAVLKALVTFVKAEPTDRYRAFAQDAMKLIDVRAREQDLFPHNQFSEAMYRAFDQLDDIFGIHYDLDSGMVTNPDQRERLYEGAGIGVQTSYSSILLALDRAKVRQGATVLDLGSGYGRVGFVLGLLRPDIDFTGYEYVDHRVQDSIAVAKRVGLSRIDFVTEDLSLSNLPPADVYYMYDPFSRETYGRVLTQLIRYGRASEITIITKGRANTWVREALALEGWLMDETCDSGTVCLFRSQPAET